VVRHSDVHSTTLGVDVNGCVGRSHPDLRPPTMIVMVVFSDFAVVMRFGFVRRCGNGERQRKSANQKYSYSDPGSLHWMSPELRRNMTATLRTSSCIVNAIEPNVARLWNIIGLHFVAMRGEPTPSAPPKIRPFTAHATRRTTTRRQGASVIEDLRADRVPCDPGDHRRQCFVKLRFPRAPALLVTGDQTNGRIEARQEL
jgi:hypothetical protein